MPEVRIMAKNFMDMVAALPAMKLDKLYDSSFICEAALRSFPPLAKKYVLQMMFIDSPVTVKSLEEWVLPDGYSKHKVAIDRLLQLRVFIEVNDRIEYQLPNLIVGAITKESLYNAFENGITAEQIISFLQQNAYPRVAEKIPTVPENVTDQIRLWETDRNRVDMIPSHLYEDFPSREVSEAACDFAREYGGLLWADSKHMRLIVLGELHQHMRDFLRRQT